MNLLIKAISFAAEKHRNQRRKDAEASPYINHPIALADVLANEAGEVGRQNLQHQRYGDKSARKLDSGTAP